MVREIKRSIRSEILELRNSLSEREITEKSLLICDKLFTIDEIANAKIFFIYSNIQSEVETSCIIETLLDQGKTVALPRIEDLDTPMALHAIDSLNNLQSGPFGIPEPHHEDPVVPEKDVDVAIIPGIAFDESGWRLGWGGGFYDRFLSKTSAISLGLAFEVQITDKLPIEMHDKQVDYIITEKRIIKI